MSRKVVDWDVGRQMYEAGASFAEIGGALKIGPDQVSKRAKEWGWKRATDIEAEERREATVKAYREFIERDREALVSSLAKKHEMNARILGLAETEIAALETGSFEGDRIKAIKDLAGVVQTVGTSDAELAAIKGLEWRDQDGDDERDDESGPFVTGEEEEEFLDPAEDEIH